MAATPARLRRRPPEITVGRKVTTALSGLWISFALIGGGGWWDALFLVALMTVGGIIADRVGNAYQDAEAR